MTKNLSHSSIQIYILGVFTCLKSNISIGHRFKTKYDENIWFVAFQSIKCGQHFISRDWLANKPSACIVMHIFYAFLANRISPELLLNVIRKLIQYYQPDFQCFVYYLYHISPTTNTTTQNLNSGAACTASCCFLLKLPACIKRL